MCPKAVGRPAGRRRYPRADPRPRVNSDGARRACRAQRRGPASPCLRPPGRFRGLASSRPGTGNTVGDPIELGAIGWFGCGAVLGLAKTNIGHLTAAGMAGPGDVEPRAPRPGPLHFETPNLARIDSTRPMCGSPALHMAPGRLVAGSILRVRGTNAHVILASPPPRPAAKGSRPRPAHPRRVEAA